MPAYYVYWYRLDRIDSYLLWYRNGRDGVVVDANRRVLAFADPAQLRVYASGIGALPEHEEPILLDLDVLGEWLKRPNTETVDCEVFLDAWNLFIDVAASVGDTAFDPDRQRTNPVYDKLFWGNNLPAMTPPGEHYEPVWSSAEVSTMRDVLGYGLKMFRSQVTTR